jgi:hypothetical protein
MDYRQTLRTSIEVCVEWILDGFLVEEVGF